jgi:hypothetical protein
MSDAQDHEDAIAFRFESRNPPVSGVDVQVLNAQIQLLTTKIQSQAVQIQQLINENKRLSQNSGHLAEQLQGDLSGVSPDLVFASYIERANDVRHQPPHRDNRDYVMDTAVAFPELGQTPPAVQQSSVILTFIEAMKVCDALLHSSLSQF